MTRCEECGFDWEVTPADAIAGLRAAAERFPRPLSRFLSNEDPDVILRTRPEPAVWSALEYAAHTRDAFAFYDDRITRVLSEDHPQLVRADFDILCEERHYIDEDPATVAEGLAGVGRALADRLDALDDAQWERVGIGVDGDTRTVLVLARRAAHEAAHHLLDMGRVLRHVRQAL
jgi:hypothetical protein